MRFEFTNTVNVNRARSGKHLYLGSLRVGHITTHVIGLIEDGVVFLTNTKDLFPEMADDSFLDPEECTDMLAIATIAFDKYSRDLYPKDSMMRIAWRARDSLMKEERAR
jgi:hypothetical protein